MVYPRCIWRGMPAASLYHSITATLMCYIIATTLTLLPQVKLTKRLDVKGAAERGLRRLPGRFVAAWAAEAGRPR